MMAIVDYGAGNITSVKRALEHVGCVCQVTCDPAVISRADRIVVPGVGNFQSTATLAAHGLTSIVEREIALAKPVLGICLGMQWLLSASEEAPGVAGLGVFPEKCRAFPAHVKSPHVGWNQLQITGESRLLKGLSHGQFVYFSHGYCAPLVKATIASCDYGQPFSAAIEQENLFGVQFHPEKSGEAGLAILENFCSC